jgi:hypothetical protein
MIFQDGRGFVAKPGKPGDVPDAFDQLIASGEMPVTIGLFINPGEDWKIVSMGHNWSEGLALGPDGKTLYTAGSDIRIYDLDGPCVAAEAQTLKRNLQPVIHRSRSREAFRKLARPRPRNRVYHIGIFRRPRDRIPLHQIIANL